MDSYQFSHVAENGISYIGHIRLLSHHKTQPHSYFPPVHCQLNQILSLRRYLFHMKHIPTINPQNSLKELKLFHSHHINTSISLLHAGRQKSIITNYSSRSFLSRLYKVWVSRTDHLHASGTLLGSNYVLVASKNPGGWSETLSSNGGIYTFLLLGRGTVFLLPLIA